MPARVLYYSCGATGEAHYTGEGHPERPARLAEVDRAVRAAGFGPAVECRQARPATGSEMGLVHAPEYLAALERFAGAGGGWIDPDTRVSAASWQAATLAAGCGLVAVDDLLRGQGESAFVAVRPPGHHATATEAMGFCLVNNIAVAAASLVQRGNRVALLDWDVHHGNGTQEIFWDDPSVLYISTHQWPAYPGTGRPDETGGPGAPGTNINIPLPPGATGDVALRALEEVAGPVVESFAPQWVLVSAGFDAHRDDPLADLAWTCGDYTLLTRLAMSWAPQPGRVVAFLEGGYDLGALGRSAVATVGALAGMDAATEAPSSDGPGADMVDALAALRRRSGRPHPLD